ncbi:MAG: prepilin-type N-terminal cleavage/methylation domain-containing protein [Deltaproteobacteria bacterium]|nr:prepilin-type N-terminal cleavage/methylation domain-containing protein [Deltaproteobacteria bacterium]
MPQNVSIRGFTLIEVLIAMAISLVVLAGVYSLYTYFIRATGGQEKLLEIQQEGRAAMERLSKEIRVAGCYYRNTPIITAAADRFEFESDTDPDPTKGPWMINYALDTAAKELVRNDAEWTGSAYGAYSASQTVSSHVKTLAFVYYDENGALLSAPIDTSLIRRVDVSMTTETDAINPSTNKKDSVTLDTSLYLRCMGVQQSTDITPCAYPTNLAAADTGTCGWTNVTWTKSASSDAAGYKIYYRPVGASFYTGTVDVGGGSTESYTLKGLSNGTAYNIVMKCVDTSGNENSEDLNSLTPVTVTLNDTAAPDVPTGTNARGERRNAYMERLHCAGRGRLLRLQERRQRRELRAGG